MPPGDAGGDASSQAPRSGELRRGVPVQLDGAVTKLLARDPGRRFQSASAVRAALEAVLDEAAAQPAPGPAARAATKRPAAKRSPGPPKARAAELRGAEEKRKAPAAARPPRETFLRTEGRWLLPTLLVIAAAVALALTVPSVRSGIDRVINVPGRDPQPIQVTRGFDYDPPPGDGRENTGRVGLAFDGNDTTSWATSSYRTADFGRLKEGVGLAFDLGSARELSGVRVTSVAGGWQGALLFSEDGRNWSSPGPGQTVNSDHTFSASGAHRYWMVWLSNLVRTPGEGNSNNGYAVAIKEVQPLGRA
jgi:hypothetical protein